MNETNGLGAVPPSPQPVPGSDAELRINEYFACIESRESDPLVPAAPPQESDKGRGCGQAYHDERGEVQDCEEGALCRRCLERQLAEARAEVEALREEVALTNEHEHQIMQERNEARDELQTARNAYAELLKETKLTEEVGGAVARAYQERDEAVRELAKVRAALLAYQEAEKTEPCAWIVETRGGNVIYWTSKERSIAEQVAASYDREAIPLYRHPPRPAPADVVTPSPAPELADLLRKRYPRLLERGNPLYDGVLAAAVERAGAADAVTVPREEWEALRALFAAVGRAIHAASTGGRATLEEINDAWAGVCSVQIAIRSSAQGGGAK